MRFDENFGSEYVFSTDQYVGSVPGPYVQEYLQQRKDLDQQGIKHRNYVAKNLGLMAGIFGGAVLLIFIFGSLWKFSHNILFMCLQFVVGGIAAGIFTLPSFTDASSAMTFNPDKARRGAFSAVSFTLAVIALFMGLVRPFNDDEILFFCIGCLFCMISIYNLIGAILSMTETSRRYSRTVTDAKCIGYVRHIKFNVGEHNRTVCYHSPVFEYIADGAQIFAVYDRFLTGPESKIALNSIETIHVNDKSPWFVQAPGRRGIVSNIIWAVILGFIACAFINGVLAGGVHGPSIQFFPPRG